MTNVSLPYIFNILASFLILVLRAILRQVVRILVTLRMKYGTWSWTLSVCLGGDEDVGDPFLGQDHISTLGLLCDPIV